MTHGLSDGWEPWSCHGQYGVASCILPWSGGRNRWHRQTHVSDCDLHPSIFFFPHWPVFHRKLSDISSSNPAILSFFSLSPSIIYLTVSLLHHLVPHSHWFKPSLGLTPPCYHILCSRVPSFFLYHHPPSLSLLLYIIYSNPVTCQCRSYSSELRRWLHWDKLYTITGRERGRSEEHWEKGEWVRHDRREELNSRADREPPVTVTDRRRPRWGKRISSSAFLNTITLTHWVCGCSIPYLCGGITLNVSLDEWELCKTWMLYLALNVHSIY